MCTLPWSERPSESLRHVFEALGSRLFVLDGCIRFHRAHFLDVFVDQLPAGIAHFGKRVVSYEKREGGEIGLAFADGTDAVCDLLVGCDGIKSVVRSQMLRTKAAEDAKPGLLELIEPKWTGTIAYRGLIPATVLPTVDGAIHRTLGYPMMYCGQDKVRSVHALRPGVRADGARVAYRRVFDLPGSRSECCRICVGDGQGKRGVWEGMGYRLQSRRSAPVFCGLGT